MSSAYNFCKQFGTRSGLTECTVSSGSKLFDTLMVFLKEFFEKIDFEKNQLMTKKRMKSYPGGKELELEEYVYHLVFSQTRLLCYINEAGTYSPFFMDNIFHAFNLLIHGSKLIKKYLVLGNERLFT